MKTDFPCVKCGLCCRMIPSIPALSGYDNGGGVCRYLVENLCAIYETRPEICNIELFYQNNLKGKMSEKEFVIKNLLCCLKFAKSKKQISTQKKLQKILNALTS